MRKILSGLVVALVCGLAVAPAAQAAPTKIGSLQVYDYTWMDGTYSLSGKVSSPKAQCRKVKRRVILKNVTQGKKLGRAVVTPASRGVYDLSSPRGKNVIRKGDRIRIHVNRRKAGKVTCAAATKVVRVKKFLQGGAG